MMILSGLISKARAGLVIIRMRDLKYKLETRAPDFYTQSWSHSLQLFCNKSLSCKEFTELFMFMKDHWKKIVVQMAKKKWASCSVYLVFLQLARQFKTSCTGNSLSKIFFKKLKNFIKAEFAKRNRFPTKMPTGIISACYKTIKSNEMMTSH